MRHILASLDSVASAADGIQKEDYNKLPPWDSNPDPSKQPGSTPLSGRFNPRVKAIVLNPLGQASPLYLVSNHMLLTSHNRQSIISGSTTISFIT